MTINLHMNENPYLPDEKVRQAAIKGLEKINRYSELKYLNELKELLGKYNKIPSDQIVLSHGSDLLLREIINIFSKDRKIIMVNPSFFPVAQYAMKQALKLIKIQISPPDFKLDPDIILDELKEPTLLIIDNPNNPTGKILLDRQLIEKILQNKNALLLVDEAYYEFSEQTFADLIKRYPNLAITRTMDKAFSLAGLRLGYLLMGNLFKNYFSNFPTYLATPALLAAIETLKNIETTQKNIIRIIKEKQRISPLLKEIGLEVFSSKTNFLLVKSKIPDLAHKLLHKNVQIHDLSGYWLSNYYRISIGRFDENEILLNAISEIYK